MFKSVLIYLFLERSKNLGPMAFKSGYSPFVAGLHLTAGPTMLIFTLTSKNPDVSRRLWSRTSASFVPSFCKPGKEQPAARHLKTTITILVQANIFSNLSYIEGHRTLLYKPASLMKIFEECQLKNKRYSPEAQDFSASTFHQTIK